MKREDVVRLRELLAKATPGPWSRYGYELADVEGVPLFGMHRERETDDAALVEAMHAALPALLALAEAVEGGEQAWVSPTGRVLTETNARFDGADTSGWKRVRLVAAPEGE